MAENASISKIAELISQDIFSEFFWTRVGTTNADWTCEEPERHNVKTHPVDIVFYYDEPYSSNRTYVHCDLKSYAKNSISKSAVHKAIESLSRQVSCAEKSNEWRTHFVHETETPEICGMLFVYNHDGEFDNSFADYTNSFDQSKLDLPKGSKLFVLGPEQITWLHNISIQIKLMRANGLLPMDKDKCNYFYPQLTKSPKTETKIKQAATLEMLTSPWIILEHDEGISKKMVIFYSRDGATTEEFMFLIEYLRLYQVLNENTKIEIKSLSKSIHAPSNFQKAQQRYIEGTKINEDSGLGKIIKSIEYKTIKEFDSTFSTVEIGME